MKKIIISLLCLACAALVFADKITLMNYAQPQEKAILDKVIASFEASHPGITVDVITVTQADYGQKIQAAMSANQLPDVLYVGPESLRQFVDSKRILNLTPYIEKARGVNFKDLYESAVDSYRYDGEVVGKGDIYALPKDFGPFALAYNKSLFERYGLPLPDKDIPYTWDEFTKICQQCTRDNTFGTGLNIFWSFIQFVWGNGADYLSADKKTVTITDPKFVEALQYFADMTLKLNMTPSAEQAQSLDTYQRWLKGELAFFPAGPWDLAAFKNLPFEFDLLPWPVKTKGAKPATYRGGVGYAVSRTSTHPQEATDLALYLSADKEANQAYCDMDLQIPNLKSLAGDYMAKGRPDNREEYLQIINTPGYGRPWPFDYTYDRVWYDKFFIGIQDVLDGRITAEAYCKKMQPIMQKDLDKSIARMQKMIKKTK